MIDEEISHALEVARRTAAEAGALAKSGFRTGGRIHKKGEIDLVTEFDLRSEELIRDRLSSAFPSHVIVGEEKETQGSGKYVWYVDPIDGTTNFAHGHPVFAVSIALYEGDEPLVGVVHAPVLGMTWWASRGAGAYWNDARCSVSKVETLGDALGGTGFPYDEWSNPDDNIGEFAAFMHRTQGVRRCGSASIDLAFVASGAYDLFWEQRLKPWDIAAGLLLIREAGGKLSDYDGNAAVPATSRLVATNGLLHEQTVALIQRTRAAAPSVHS